MRTESAFAGRTVTSENIQLYVHVHIITTSVYRCTVQQRCTGLQCTLWFPQTPQIHYRISQDARFSD